MDRQECSVNMHDRVMTTDCLGAQSDLLYMNHQYYNPSTYHVFDSWKIDSVHNFHELSATNHNYI